MNSHRLRMNGTTIETISLRQGEAPYGNGALLFTETKSEWLWRLFLDEALFGKILIKPNYLIGERWSLRSIKKRMRTFTAILLTISR